LQTVYIESVTIDVSSSWRHPPRWSRL